MTTARQRSCVFAGVVAAALLFGSFVVAAASPDAEAQVPPVAAFLPADNGAKITREIRVNERTVDLEIDSEALSGKNMVRLLLPAGWAEQPERTWPQLWLLHGCCEIQDYKSWTAFSEVEAFTADKPALVVMPSDGPAGMYTAWWNFGLNMPDWETFHMTEVRQLVERNYRGSDKRSVAGISIGGFGAMHYAFRHPDLFGAAASYSGMPDTLLTTVPGVIKTILAREGFWNWMALWGEERWNTDIWRSHNPADNVEKLRGKALYVSAGNGEAGPLDPDPDEVDPILEPSSLRTSQSFTDKLQRAGIPVTVDYYGQGSHSWPYWERALHRSWSLLAGGMGI